jgi:hypothetical protein
MKQILAHVLFYTGDKVSHLMNYEPLSYVVYPVYNKLMQWSFDLDTKGEIWQ